jgi:hypothetical protein
MTELRIKVLQGPQENYTHNPTDPGIPVATDGPHKGLRVRIIRHSDAEREALKALGDKRA